MYRRLFSYLAPHRKRFALALAAMVVFGASDGCIPLLLKYVLDDVFVSHRIERLWLLIGSAVFTGDNPGFIRVHPAVSFDAGRTAKSSRIFAIRL